MKLKGIITVTLAALAFAACTQNEIIPDATLSSVKFAQESVSLANTGETVTAAINANCDWTVSTDASWIKLAPVQGTKATKSITITVDEPNTAEGPREAEVILAAIADQFSKDTLVVIQKGASGTLDGKLRTAEDVITFIELAPNATSADEYEFANDIDMEGATLTPAASFAGVLDGKNFKLYNFKIVSPTAFSGLIATNNGIVRNLIIGSADGKAWDKTSSVGFADGVSAAAAGAVAGTNAGTIENVVNFASVDINTSTSGDDACAGGIAGNMGNTSAIIKACKNYGSITISGKMAARASFGGILGFSGQSGATVEDCVNYGAISKGTANEKELAMSGVVGRAGTKVIIKGCSNEGPVSYESTAKPGSYVHIAGIIGAGYHSCEVLNCTNKGTISSVINQVNRMGGIAGTINTGGTIENCVNEGMVTINQEANANWQSAAGIVGFEEKATPSTPETPGEPLVVKNNINRGDVTLTLNNSNTHNNRVSLGGVIGCTCSNAEYVGNTNYGKISCTNTGSSEVYAGGLFGWYRAGTGFKSSGNVNNGDVTVEAPAGAAGGVIGYQSVASCTSSEDTNKGKISYGATNATTGSVAGLYAGALNACVAGGEVNGTKVTSANFMQLIVGSTSTGTLNACKADDGGSTPAYYLTAGPAELNFAAAGETLNANISCNCEWTVSASQSWISASPATGDATVATVALTAAENLAKEERSATVTFTCKADSKVSATITVKQAGHVEGLVGTKITSAADFAAFAAISANAASTDVYTLEADITLTSTNFATATGFAGTFDGQNHTITFSDVEVNAEVVSLFTDVTGTIKNLKTAGSLKTIYSGGNEYIVAPVVGRLTGGKVDNCSNAASVTNASTIGTSNKYGYPGGVVGIFNTDGAIVSNCSNSGKITVKAPSCQILGGVVCYGQTSSSAPTLTIESCTNTGDIELDHTGGNWNYIGGIVGKMGASSNPFTYYCVKNCKNSGKITVISAPKIRGGGIFGSAGQSTAADVTGNEFTGTIDVQDTQAVDRLFAGVGPGFAESAAYINASNNIFNGTIGAVDGGNLYISGIIGVTASPGIVVDGCKTTSKASINAGTKPKTVGMVAARLTGAGATIKNCKIAGKITDATGTEITISATNIEDWMFKGSISTSVPALENNGFNAE